MLNLSLQQKYFDAIKSGLKTAEGRPNSSKFKDLHPGDTISFTCVTTNEVIVCTVQVITLYQNFYEMLQAQGVHNMLPGVATIEDGIAVYENFPGYKERVKSDGVIAIALEVYS